MTDTPGPARTEDLLHAVRRSPLFRGVVAMETSFGWPIPQLRRRDDAVSVFLTVPLVRTAPCPNGGVYLYPPHAQLTIGWPVGRVVAYRDHVFDDPWLSPVDPDAPVGSFPHPGLPRDTAAYRQLRSTAYGHYDELLRLSTSGTPAPAAFWARFGDVLGPLLEPGLLPFYRVLGPKFLARVAAPARPAEGGTR